MGGSKTVVCSLGERVAGEWFAELEVSGKSERTISYYRRTVRLWISWLAAKGLTYDRAERREVIGFLGSLRANCKPSSIKTYLAVLSSWYDWLLDCQYITQDPTRRVTIKATQTIPDPPSREEIAELLKAATTLLDKALVHGLLTTGCRISEFLALEISRVRLEAREATVLGKGGKERIVYFSPDAAEVFKQLIGGRVSGHLLLRNGSPVSPRLAHRRLKALSKNAGTSHVHAHRLRHAYGTQLFENGADIRDVQELLGHASLTTTQRYTHVARPRLRDVYERARPKDTPLDKPCVDGIR